MVVGKKDSILLTKPQLIHLFFTLGMCPCPDMRRALAIHIEGLSLSSFISFAARVFEIVDNFTVLGTDGATCPAPKAYETATLRFATRPHPSVKFKCFNEKLRGARANAKGTPFHVLQDDGTWAEDVTNRPLFARCIRPEFVMFLTEESQDTRFSIDSAKYRNQPELVKKTKDFYIAELFEAIWYAL